MPCRTDGWLPMGSPQSPNPVSSAGLAALLSVAAHLAFVGGLLVAPGRSVNQDPNRILPALYLYAPDRRPATPRELRIPIPAPPGVPDATADHVLQSRLPITAGEPQGEDLAGGMPIPGPGETRLDSVFSALAVDSEVARFDESAMPAYPARLLVEGTEGLVVAEFVVDTTGRVDLGTVAIRESTDPEFTESVRTALAGMQFRPAWRGLRKVRQLVSQRFAFRLVRPPSPAES